MPAVCRYYPHPGFAQSSWCLAHPTGRYICTHDTRGNSCGQFYHSLAGTVVAPMDCKRCIANQKRKQIVACPRMCYKV